MPELCLFCGYTLILALDKVFLDTHGMLAKDEEVSKEGEVKLDDPSDNRFVNEVLELV